MQEMQVLSLSREDPLKKEMATHSSILAWGIHGQRRQVGNSPWGQKESDTLGMHEQEHRVHWSKDEQNSPCQISVICALIAGCGFGSQKCRQSSGSHYIWVSSIVKSHLSYS